MLATVIAMKQSVPALARFVKKEVTIRQICANENVNFPLLYYKTAFVQGNSRVKISLFIESRPQVLLPLMVVVRKDCFQILEKDTSGL